MENDVLLSFMGFRRSGWEFIPAFIERWIDGDTLIVNARLPMGITIANVIVRVSGIDAPEKKGRTLQAGLNAEFAANNCAPAGAIVWLGEKELKTDKYGRLIAHVIALKRDHWLNVGDVLVSQKHARRVKF
jgi:endonuclease YncB( thermonuclease family)